MGLRKNLKKAVIGVALAGTLLGTGYSKGNKEETKDSEAKMEQRVEGKSEMRQKIAYLDEYVAEVESGKNKEQAYRKFILKMADNNAKEVIKLQEQVEKIRREQRGRDMGFLLCLILGGLLLKNDLKFNFKSVIPKKSNEPYKRGEMGFRDRN